MSEINRISQYQHLNYRKRILWTNRDTIFSTPDYYIIPKTTQKVTKRKIKGYVTKAKTKKSETKLYKPVTDDLRDLNNAVCCSLREDYCKLFAFTN